MKPDPGETGAREFDFVMCYRTIVHDPDAAYAALRKCLPSACVVVGSSAMTACFTEDRIVSSLLSGKSTVPMMASSLGVWGISFGAPLAPASGGSDGGNKFREECGSKLRASAKFCSGCGTHPAG